MRLNNLLLVIASGVLLAAPWVTPHLWMLSFIAFVPILIAFHSQHEKTKRTRDVFAYSLAALLVWNVCAGWWVAKASLKGVLMLMVVNPFLQLLPLVLWGWVSRWFSRAMGLAIFVALWVGWEWVQLHVSGFVPWLVLGNSLGSNPMIIQWYEVTGTLGGSAWILSINVLIFTLLTTDFETSKTTRKKVFAALGFAIAIPLLTSFYRWTNFEVSQGNRHVTVIQSTFDCYKEKFGSISQEKQIEDMLSIARGLKEDSVSRVIIFPETAIHEKVDEQNISSNNHASPFIHLCEKPGLSLVVGVQTTKNGHEYNSLLKFSHTKKPEVYHKTILLPGVEYVPLVENSVMSRVLMVNTGSPSTYFDNTPANIRFENGISIVPAICFESVYGEYIARRCGEGVSLVSISTNDGWWGDSPGQWQHAQMANLRAIETRRTVARSANYGISTIVSPRGETMARVEYGKRGSVSAAIDTNTTRTFYSTWGDWIGVISLGVSAFYIIAAMWRSHQYSRKINRGIDG